MSSILLCVWAPHYATAVSLLMKLYALCACFVHYITNAWFSTEWMSTWMTEKLIEWISYCTTLLEKTTRTPLHHMAKHHPTRPEMSQSHTPWSSRYGSESLSVEVAVDVRHYAILQLHDRNDDDDDHLIWQMIVNPSPLMTLSAAIVGSQQSTHAQSSGWAHVLAIVPWLLPVWDSETVW